MKYVAVLALCVLGVVELLLRLIVFGALCVVLIGLILVLELHDDGTNLFQPFCFTLAERLVGDK